MSRILFSVLLLIVCFTLMGSNVQAQEENSRYVTLSYSGRELLKEFNNNLRLNRKLSSYIRKKNVVTVADEVMAKVDIIVEKVQVVLDMFPDKYHIHLVLLQDSGDVARVYKERYGKNVNHIAYYSLSEKTVYISVDDTRLRVLAHEIGHSVVDHYFEVRPPYNIHELMAQFAEKHVTD